MGELRLSALIPEQLDPVKLPQVPKAWSAVVSPE